MMLFRVLIVAICALIGCAGALPSPLFKKVIVKQPIFVQRPIVSHPVIVQRPVLLKTHYAGHGGWW
uniref:Uncharacterized protein n=1 Tax=Anopheles albimanus TaxID=7167 RepID=A0A182FA96_ANOAL